MKTPTGYREIGEDEVILETDRFQYTYESAPIEPLRGSPVYHLIGMTRRSYCHPRPVSTNWSIFRKIESPWIDSSIQLPVLLVENGWPVRVLVKWKTDGSVGLWSICDLSGRSRGEYWWMPIPEAPEPIIPPITIQEGSRTHEVKFNPDKSITVGCTTVPKETMQKIVERWRDKQFDKA